MPPARPPTTGRPFQSASLTVSPKPSRSDFCTHHVGDALERVDLHVADLLDVREQVDVGVAGARASCTSSQTRNPSGSSVAIEPASTSCASVTFSRTIRNASITPTGSFHGS